MNPLYYISYGKVLLSEPVWEKEHRGLEKLLCSGHDTYCYLSVFSRKKIMTVF